MAGARGQRDRSQDAARAAQAATPGAQAAAPDAAQAAKAAADLYVDRVMERARALRDSDAFAPPEPADRTRPDARGALAAAKASARSSRTWIAVFSALCLAIAAFSLLLPYHGIDSMGAGGEIYSPGDVLDCYVLWFQMNVWPLFDPTQRNLTGAMYTEFLQTHDATMYTLVMNRAVVTVITAGCGLLLALSGLLFQSAFRNPLATPSMLGVSEGVTLGCVIYVMLGNSSIGENPGLYLALVYGLGALAVVFVLFMSRFVMGSSHHNVLDMLLVGTVVCQLVGGVNSFVQTFVMDYMEWFNFYDIQQASDALQQPLVAGVVVVVFAATFIPAFVLRFKLNLISFSDEEGTMMGVRAGLLRALALVLGSAMQLAALASIGQVAMISLAVPFLVRYMMPADFRSQFLGNCLVGMAVLLACMALQHFATVGIVTMPVGTIVSIFIVPLFVWMMALGQGRW